MSDLHIINDTKPDSKYRRLLDFIPYGSENAVSMTLLSYMLNMTPRDIRKIVENARKDGNIIGSLECGYFIPQSREELLAYYRRSISRISTNLKSLKAVKELLKEEGTLDYEETLFS